MNRNVDAARAGGDAFPGSAGPAGIAWEPQAKSNIAMITSQ